MKRQRNSNSRRFYLLQRELKFRSYKSFINGMYDGAILDKNRELYLIQTLTGKVR